MAESIAVVVASDRPQVVRTVLDLLSAAISLEDEAHLYFTGDAIAFVGRPGAAAVDTVGDALREDVAARLREMKADGALHVYACTRAMKAHDIERHGLAAEVDMPAGFVYFLSVAADARLTFSF
jgi:peroxiredoxin family protein